MSRNLLLRLLPAAALALVISSAACDGGQVESDLGYGLGERADGLGCDPREDLCWNSRDIDAMRDLHFLQGELALERGVPEDTLIGLLEQVHRLEHKLNDEELASLRDLIAQASTRDAGAVHTIAAELDRALLYRLTGTFNATLMAEVGRIADESGNEKADEDSASTIHQTGYTQGMIDSLSLLRESGVLGRSYALILETSGILEIDYAELNAQNFGEWDEANQRIVPSGTSRDAKAKSIIDDYKHAAGFLGVATGAESLIPIAGIAISISHETYALFKLHARMTFEIAAVYGWDIREGRNLFSVVTMLLTDGLIADTADSLISNGLVPLASNALARKVGLELPQDLAVKMAKRSIGTLFSMLKREGAEALAKAATKAGAKALGKQVLGWATVGLAVFVSGAVDWVVTEKLGQHIQLVARNWVADLMMEGSTFLSRPAPRDCFFVTAAQIASADGTLSDNEAKLYEAFVNKPYHEDESSWIFLANAEKTRQRAVLQSAMSAPSSSSKACIAASFEDSQSQHKLSLLSYLYTMMQIDGDAPALERNIYQAYVEVLKGQGLFDGPSIGEDSLLYMERAVRLATHPTELEVPEEYQSLIDQVLPEEMLPFLQN